MFLCIRCAGIHRNLGVHISKVKSVNLDSWTPEQVVSLQQMGNSRARAVYEANLPDNFRRPQSDSSLESFIRAKYEHKKYIAREWVPPQIPKVDWEKEIDEEIERQKRKKKAAAADKKTAIKLPTATEVPQLPKPKSNASPKPARSTPHETPKPTTYSENLDLLGLQNGDDGFSGFLSAGVTTETTKKDEITDAVKAEEKSFFNQPAPSEKERSKMTKDSIMALYGNAPPQPIVYPPQVGAFQPGVAPNAFPPTYQYSTQGFASTVPQNYTPQSFTLQNGSSHIPNMAPNVPFMAQQPQTMPFAAPQQFIAASSYGQAFGTIPQGQFQTPMGPTVPMAAPANPFCGTMPLQQQFAGINLTGPPVNNSNVGKPAAANIWQ